MPSARCALLLLSLAGTATALAPATAGAQKKERDLITREELIKTAEKFPDLYRAIRAARPHFLVVNRGIRNIDIQPGAAGTRMCKEKGQPNCAYRSAGNDLPPLPVLYIDDAKLGEIELLRNIHTEDVEEVRYLSPTQPGVEFGLGHEGGAILVKMYKPLKPPPSER